MEIDTSGSNPTECSGLRISWVRGVRPARERDMDIAHPRSDVRARDADIRARDADPCAEHEAQRAKQRVPDDKRKRGVRPWEMARVSRKTWYTSVPLR